MLSVAFFGAFFASASWLIYAYLYVKAQLGNVALFEQSPEILLNFMAIVVVPVLLIWFIFGYANQFIANRAMNIKQGELLRQLQKNQDYTDLVVRVMLETEHEIKDGFVINKFDTFIADMHESLSEIIQRCNIASTAQLDQLWQRVLRGERWALGKAVIDAGKNQNTFNAWVREKITRDKVFRGTLLEFCSRYQNLLQLLEKHDRDRVFLRIVETGVFGKVYSIIAPLSEGIVSPQAKAEPQEENEYASVLKIATMEEPKASDSIVNVDKDVEENDAEDDDLSAYAPRESFFSRLNPFKRQGDESDLPDTGDDPFFQALHNSFSDNGEPALSERTPSLSADIRSAGEYGEKSEPHIGSEPRLSAETPVFAATNENQPKTDENEKDLAYPFGGWTDEKNYR